MQIPPMRNSEASKILPVRPQETWAMYQQRLLRAQQLASSSRPEETTRSRVRFAAPRNRDAHVLVPPQSEAKCTPPAWLSQALEVLRAKAQSGAA